MQLLKRWERSIREILHIIFKTCSFHGMKYRHYPQVILKERNHTKNSIATRAPRQSLTTVPKPILGKICTNYIGELLGSYT